MRKTPQAPTISIGYNNKNNAITKISAIRESQNNGNGIASNNKHYFLSL
jgi:hypothetical protein